MSPLPKSLEEMRDKLSFEYYESENVSDLDAYSSGFSSAADLMLKDMESMAKALEKAQNVGEIKFCTNVFSKQVSEEIEEALKNYREKYGVSK